MFMFIITQEPRSSLIILLNRWTDHNYTHFSPTFVNGTKSHLNVELQQQQKSNGGLRLSHDTVSTVLYTAHLTCFSSADNTPSTPTTWYCLCFRLPGSFRTWRMAVDAVSLLINFRVSDDGKPGSKSRRHRLPFFRCSKPTMERLCPTGQSDEETFDIIWSQNICCFQHVRLSIHFSNGFSSLGSRVSWSLSQMYTLDWSPHDGSDTTYSSFLRYQLLVYFLFNLIFFYFKLPVQTWDTSTQSVIQMQVKTQPQLN